MAEVHDRPDDHEVVGVRRHLSDERAVDLDLVHRQPAQVRERREARAEVVDARADASVAERTEDFDGEVEVVDHLALGDLEHESVGRHAAVGQLADDEVGQARVVEVAGAEVHGDTDVDAQSVPGLHLGDRLADHLAGQLVDEAGDLGELDELVGPDHPELRVQPTHQRLDTHDGAEIEVDLRLVEDGDLVAAERPGQLAEQAQPSHRVLVVAGRVGRPPLTGGLGLVHGDLGPLQQFLGLTCVVGEQGVADRRRGLHLQVLEGQRCRDAVEDLLGDALGAARAVAGEHHRELVATEPGDEVGAAPQVGETGGHLTQQGVAVVVAERVIDLFELIEVEHEQRDVGARVGTAELLTETLHQVRTVRQTRQRIVQRLAALVLPRGHALGHVVEHDRHGRGAQGADLEVEQGAVDPLGRSVDLLAEDRFARRQHTLDVGAEVERCHPVDLVGGVAVERSDARPRRRRDVRTDDGECRAVGAGLDVEADDQRRSAQLVHQAGEVVRPLGGLALHRDVGGHATQRPRSVRPTLGADHVTQPHPDAVAGTDAELPDVGPRHVVDALDVDQQVLVVGVDQLAPGHVLAGELDRAVTEDVADPTTDHDEVLVVGVGLPHDAGDTVEEGTEAADGAVLFVAEAAGGDDDRRHAEEQRDQQDGRVLDVDGCGSEDRDDAGHHCGDRRCEAARDRRVDGDGREEADHDGRPGRRRHHDTEAGEDQHVAEAGEPRPAPVGPGTPVQVQLPGQRHRGEDGDERPPRVGPGVVGRAERGRDGDGGADRHESRGGDAEQDPTDDTGGNPGSGTESAAWRRVA